MLTTLVRLPRVPVLVALILAFSLSGCREINGSLARREALAYHGATTLGDVQETYAITDDVIKGMHLAGPVTSGPIEVFYPKALEPLATSMAKEMHALYQTVEDETAVRLQYKLRLYLISTPDFPQYYGFALASKERVLSFPVFVKDGCASLAEVFSGNKYLSFYMFHELTEASLTKPAKGTPVLVATYYGLFFVLHRTRWFREGFSNYCAFIATERLKKDCGPISGSPVSPGFLTLREADGKLFTWTQLGNSRAEAAYYDAAFGLFLIIEKRYGREKIREVIRGMDSLQYADGPALISLFNRTLDTDLVRMVKEFRFPQLGIWIDTPSTVTGVPSAKHPKVAKVRRGSVAADAGLAPGDLILTIDGSPVEDFFDFDMALLNAMGRPCVDIGIERGGEQKTLAVSLDPRLTAPARLSRKEQEEALAFRGLDITIGVQFR